MLDINLNIEFYNNISQNKNMLFNFSLTMLTIQATVSVLTLTLFNFILQMKQTNIFGYNYSQFIFENVSLCNENSKKLKVKNSLGIALLLIIINAVLIFLAFYFSLSWIYLFFSLLFILSLLMIKSLSSIIFKLVIDQEKFELEVKKHLQVKLLNFIKNTKDDGELLPEEIKNIKNSCFKNIEQRKIQSAQKEAEFILELMCDISLFDADDGFLRLSKMLLEIAIKFLEEDHLDEAQSIIINYLTLLGKANMNLDKHSTLLNHFYLKMNRKLKFKSYNEIYNINPFNLISKIYKLYGFKGAQKIDLFSTFALTIARNEDLESEYKISLLSELYQSVFSSEVDYLEKVQINLSILKSLLDCLSLKEIDVFASVLNEIMNSSSNKVKYYLNLSLSIYFYYLMFFKKDLRREYREKIKELNNGIFIEDSLSHSINEFKFPKNIEVHLNVFEFYPLINKILRQSKWEKIPVINFKKRSFHKKQLPSIIRKFFVYYMFQMKVEGFKNKDEAFIENIHLNELSKIITELFHKDGKVKKDAFKEYNNFLDLYNKKINDCLELRKKSKDFYKYLKYIYKKKYLKTKTEYKWDEIKANKEKLKELIKNKIIDNSLYKLSDFNLKFKEEIKNEFEKLPNITTELLTEAYNMDDFAENYKRLFVNKLVNKIKRKFNDSVSLSIDKYSASIIPIFNKINYYNINTVIYSDSIENYLKQDKFDNQKYDGLTDNFEMLEINNDISIYFNRDKIDFYINNINVEFDSFSDDEIEEMYCKKPGISVGNIFIEMDIDEFSKYKKMNNLEIYVSYDCYINVKEESGFYVEFDY
ncbi:hypothetical protein ACTWKD_04240 [Halanaerobium saccharolyticum]|uniref:hypothetical protein n=1 Tax=Halanaerobium saccharolyticum TaxID=43595 RepID=UPI003FCC9B64